jgi:hypothetical protein
LAIRTDLGLALSFLGQSMLRSKFRMAQESAR